MRSRPIAVRRLGALGVSVTEDAERLRERLRLANAEHERLASMADGWWHISWRIGRAGRRGPALSPRARTFHRSRAAGLDALARTARRISRWRRLATLAGALGRAGLPAQGGGLPRARRASTGLALGAALRGRRGGLDRGRLSDRRGGAGGDRGCGGGEGGVTAPRDRGRVIAGTPRLDSLDARLTH